MNNNFLAIMFDWLGEVFEKFNPAAFRFLAAFLPYLSPIPVAWITQQSAGEYLHFNNTVGFIFVFTLEGIGLWFTSLLVDSIVDWIKSRNKNAWIITFVLSMAVLAYITILISLNVLLESSTEGYTTTYGIVVGLLCVLPLITGIGNGYYKFQLKSNRSIASDLEYQRNLGEQIRQEKREDRLKGKLIKAGMNPLLRVPAYQETVEDVTPVSKGDWRHLSKKEKDLVRTTLSIPEIMKTHNVSRSTAFDWKRKSD